MPEVEFSATDSRNAHQSSCELTPWGRDGIFESWRSLEGNHRVLEAMRVEMDLLKLSRARPLVFNAKSRLLHPKLTIALYRLLRKKTITRLLQKVTSNRRPAGICFLGGKAWHVSSEKNGSGLINITKAVTNKALGSLELDLYSRVA